MQFLVDDFVAVAGNDNGRCRDPSVSGLGLLNIGKKIGDVAGVVAEVLRPQHQWNGGVVQIARWNRIGVEHRRDAAFDS